VKEVVIFDKKRPATWARTWRMLRRRKYDVVIDCMAISPSFTTSVLLLASGAPHRIGIGGRQNAFAITIPVAPMPDARHHIEHSAALGAAFGVDPASTDWRPELFLSTEERTWAGSVWGDADRARLRVLVNVSSKGERRVWPEERYVKVLDHLRNHPAQPNVVVIGAPFDETRAARLAAGAGFHYQRTPRLFDAAALVASANLLFTPDTGIAHVATAVRTPAVILFFVGNDVVWGPYGSKGRSVVSTTDWLRDLPLEPAIDALDAMLSELATAESRTPDR
jgi:ADP-heptose:LPS heptosyltransferase